MRFNPKIKQAKCFSKRVMRLSALPFETYVLGGLLVFPVFFSASDYLGPMLPFTIGYGVSCLALITLGVAQLIIKDVKGGLVNIVLSISTFYHYCNECFFYVR
jgi:hypothetical protein